MPEIRFIENYDTEGNLIDKIPYKVSDEELQIEADTARLKEICDMGHSAIPLPILAEAFVLLCKKLTFK